MVRTLPGNEFFRQNQRKPKLAADKIKKKKAALEAKIKKAETKPAKVAPKVAKKPAVHLKASLTPGTVVIILLGKFAGRRALFLKQSTLGFAIVSGPGSLNGVTIRRYRQDTLIATTTKIDISSINLDHVDDALFAVNQKKEKRSKKAPKTEAEFFTSPEQKTKEPTPEQIKKKEASKALDKQLVPLVKAVPFLKKYLRSKFTLIEGVYPHTIKF